MATPKLNPDQIAQVSGLVCQYITAQRGKYAARAVPLSAQQRAPLEPFFSREVLDSVRVLVLEGERVPNPEFYPMLRDFGFRNLPDQSAMGAITFCDVVVSHATAQLPLPMMKQEIIDRVAAWRGGPAVDDVSLVVLEIDLAG